jgi:hypothetical protein
MHKTKLSFVLVEKRIQPEKYFQLVMHEDTLNGCKNRIHPGYIRQSAETADKIIVSYFKDPYTRKKVQRGFALVTNRPDNLYINVICANKSGKEILQLIDFIANQTQKCVILDALSNVIHFYRKLGFSLAQPGEKETDLVKSLANKKVSVYNSSFTASQDTTIRKLLQTLIQQKLTSNANCKDVEQCEIDGFTMSRCPDKSKWVNKDTLRKILIAHHRPRNHLFSPGKKLPVVPRYKMFSPGRYNLVSHPLKY